MKDMFFFIGTEAELIKLFPVIIECEKCGSSCHIISSGQNNITDSTIFKYTDCSRPELVLSDEIDIKKTAFGLLLWWITTYCRATGLIKRMYREIDFENVLMVVHGDTISTFMGAKLGRKLGMTVCHVEAGLRSHNLFNPFPEEIDRMLTSGFARIHFAPGTVAEKNLKKSKGIVYNTIQNTLYDSLEISKRVKADDSIEQQIGKRKKYFVFVIHRQENLANERMVRKAIENLIEISKGIPSVVILHAITRLSLIKYGLLTKLEESDNIDLLDRVDYFSFMKLLNNSEFVITDGGSNQEELYYMGKPTLIIRKKTERSEGIDKNAVLYKDIDDMLVFAEKYKEYRFEPNISGKPSEYIAKKLVEYGEI